MSLKDGENVQVECQTAWIRMRRKVSRHLIRIQAVCIWPIGGLRFKQTSVYVSVTVIKRSIYILHMNMYYINYRF